MYLVYSLQSLKDPDRFYIGRTEDLEERLHLHNRGEVFHTAKWRPWRVVVTIPFEDERKAIAFERYVKSGWGRAFAKRHFGPGPIS
jgi:predicted GIY-YIG superfamily endonuclease